MCPAGGKAAADALQGGGTMQSLTRGIRWLLLTSSLCGCHLLLDVDPQCVQSADCEALLGPGHVCGADGACSALYSAGGATRSPLPPRWECLEDQSKVVELDSQRKVPVALDIYDYATSAPVAGISVRACAQTDALCEEPIVADLETKADGSVEFDLPYGFDGHFELTGSPMLPLLFTDLPITEQLSLDVPMIKPQTLTANAELGGDRYDPRRGFVLLSMFDCYGKPAAGVRLDAPGDLNNRPFYIDGALPTRDLQSTVINQLGQPPEPVAMAGFINVTPGFATFRATLEGSGHHVGYLTLQARAGAMTLARFQAGYE
jgi:hypothetical protein